jgi:sucrose-6-phosphate hydrolase SacC (GH32 family)
MTYHEDRQDVIVERRVTYTLEKDGRFFLVENVPARVDLDTGEQFFAPQTVEQLQRMILGGGKPIRMVETPVYQFAG